MYAIDDNVPMPGHLQEPSKYVYPVDKLEPGQSFAAPIDIEEFQELSKGIRDVVRYAISKVKVDYPQRQFAYLFRKEDGRWVIRVWRKPDDIR